VQAAHKDINPASRPHHGLARSAASASSLSARTYAHVPWHRHAPYRWGPFASYRLVQKRRPLFGREGLQAGVLVDSVHCPGSCWRYVLFRRIGAQYPYRNFDEVNPKQPVQFRFANVEEVIGRLQQQYDLDLSPPPPA
jgi:hypothetical protein